MQTLKLELIRFRIDFWFRKLILNFYEIFTAFVFFIFLLLYFYSNFWILFVHNLCNFLLNFNFKRVFYKIFLKEWKRKWVLRTIEANFSSADVESEWKWDGNVEKSFLYKFNQKNMKKTAVHWSAKMSKIHNLF